MSAIKYYAIIVGGGSGSRMKSDIPKQFLPLKGRPVLMHTIDAFHSSSLDPEIIVVLNVDYHKYWENLCKKHNYSIPHQLVRGGLQRFHSVQNGLKKIKGNAIVAIHDAVRPLINPKFIDLAFQQAEVIGTAIAAVGSRDSVRQRNQTGTVSLNREDIYLIQTPQVFKSNILRKAYKQDYRNEFTDDATVVDRSGVEINLIEGDIRNIKITFPEDILIAEIYLNEKK